MVGRQPVDLPECSQRCILLVEQVWRSSVIYRSVNRVLNAAKSLCERALNIVNDARLTQLQKEPTRQDQVLDLLCTSNPSLLKSIETVPGISDHDGIVVADFYLRAHISKKPPHSIPLWSRANWNAMHEASQEFCTKFNEVAPTRSIEENWSAFETHMKQLMKEHVPKKNVGGRFHLPWMTSALRRMCRKKGRLHAKAKRNKSHWKEFEAYQKQTQKALKIAHWQYLNNMLTQGLEDNDQKPFWRYIRSQRQDSQGVSPLLKGNKLHSDPATKAEILSQQFSSVFTVDEPDTSNISLEGPSYPLHDPLHVTEAGVLKLLKNLNPG